MAIIEKDIEVIGKKASYVEKMIEIYFKTKDNIVARFGQEWFDNKIVETVDMLPDGNTSLLMRDDDNSTTHNDNEEENSDDEE